MPELSIKYIEEESGISLFDYSAPADGFYLNIEIGIGNRNKNGSDTFSFNLFDEKGLLKMCRNDPEFEKNKISSLAGYKIIMMKKYDYQALLEYLDSVIKRIPSNLPWKQQGMLLSKYFSWEFEDEVISGIK